MEIKIGNIPQNPKIKLIELKGALDFISSKELHRQVIPVIESGNHFMIADLSKLDYINSTGISCLLECFAKAKQKGGYFRFFAINDRVKETLELVGLTKVMPIFNTLEEALKAPV